MTDARRHEPEAATWRWLAQFYVSPPSPAQLAAYRTADGRALMAEMAHSAPLANFVAMLRDLTGDGVFLGHSADLIEAAHSRAFSVAGPRSAPPYASFYLSDRGLLFQKPVRDMNDLLHRLDVRPSETFHEPSDHIAVQLNVLANLIEREALGADTPLTAATFLDGYLLTWLEAFSGRCAGLTGHGFYRVLTKAVLRLAQQAIADARGGSDQERLVG